jgi:starvation-inducible DNA-binding protein
MQTSIGIKSSSLEKITLQLSHLLADEFVLYTKTLNAHWNVEGPDFYGKHLFFDAQYNQLAQVCDDVAERIRSLGHYAPASLNNFLDLTHLTEKSQGNNSSIAYMQDLLQDHNSVIEFLRGSVDEFAELHKDAGTSDFITALIERHEKMAWMLRAHLA